MGSQIPSKGIQQGYHFDKGQWPDTRYVRCSRCGFPCNLDRDLTSHPGGYEGWGIVYVQQYIETTIVTNPVIAGSTSFSRPRITTEQGIALFTEDGNTIITET